MPAILLCTLIRPKALKVSPNSKRIESCTPFRPSRSAVVSMQPASLIQSFLHTQYFDFTLQYKVLFLYTMFRFDRGYFVWVLVLFAVEVFIALFVRDAYVRPVGGDFLVVIMLYCVVKSFTTIHTKITAPGVLLFSYLIETAQHYNIVGLLGLQDIPLARVVIGTNFSWTDMAAYTAGVVSVTFIDFIIKLKATWNIS